MSFWAGIKYALNSTIGTNEFKPLDEIILGEKTFTGSDATLINLKVDDDASSSYSGVCEPQFKFNLGGVIRIKSNVTNSTSYGADFSVTLGNIDDNTSEKRTFEVHSSTTTDLVASFNIIPNKTYKISWDGHTGFSNGYASANSIEVCGQVIDSNYFTLIEQ